MLASAWASCSSSVAAMRHRAAVSSDRPVAAAPAAIDCSSCASAASMSATVGRVSLRRGRTEAAAPRMQASARASAEPLQDGRLVERRRCLLKDVSGVSELVAQIREQRQCLVEPAGHRMPRRDAAANASQRKRAQIPLGELQRVRSQAQRCVSLTETFEEVGLDLRLLYQGLCHRLELPGRRDPHLVVAGLELQHGRSRLAIGQLGPRNARDRRRVVTGGRRRPPSASVSAR